MNINYKQPQFELFPANSSTLEDVNKPRFLLANLTLSLESLVILSILGIMIALFSFCIGIERGKRLTAQVLDERAAAVWNVSVRKPMPKSMFPAAVVSSVPAKGNAGFVSAAPRPAVVHAVKPAPVVKQPAAVISGTRTTLQLATYKNEEFARIEAAALRAKGYQAFLIKRGDFILVCVGQFANAEAATAALKKLPPHYRSSQLRRF